MTYCQYLIKVGRERKKKKKKIEKYFKSSCLRELKTDICIYLFSDQNSQILTHRHSSASTTSKTTFSSAKYFQNSLKSTRFSQCLIRGKPDPLILIQYYYLLELSVGPKKVYKYVVHIKCARVVKVQ